MRLHLPHVCSLAKVDESITIVIGLKVIIVFTNALRAYQMTVTSNASIEISQYDSYIVWRLMLNCALYILIEKIFAF